MTQPKPSTQLKNPLVGMQVDDLGAMYIGKLERRVIMLTLIEVRLRARLEFATGEAWDSEDIANLSGDALAEEVAQSLVRGLGIDYLEAMKRVRLNWDLANPADVKAPTFIPIDQQSTSGEAD